VDRADRLLGQRPGRTRADPGRRTRPTTNIVAYWVPDAAPIVGKPFDHNYRMRWQMPGQIAGRPGLRGADAARPRLRAPARRRSEFSSSISNGPALRALGARRENSSRSWRSARTASWRDRNLVRNAVSGAWRMTVRVSVPTRPSRSRWRASLRLAQKHAGRGQCRRPDHHHPRSLRPGATSFQLNWKEAMNSNARAHPPVQTILDGAAPLGPAIRCCGRCAGCSATRRRIIAARAMLAR